MTQIMKILQFYCLDSTELCGQSYKGYYDRKLQFGSRTQCKILVITTVASWIMKVERFKMDIWVQAYKDICRTRIK